MRRLLVALTFALIAPCLVPAVPARAEAPDCLNDYYLWMYEVEVNELEPRYRIGTKVHFQIAVTTPSETNPADPALPWTDPPLSEPAPDVPVAVQVVVGPKGREVYLWNTGTTDAQGLVDIPIKLEKHVRPGMAQAVVFAKKEVASDPSRCANVYFVGRKYMPNAFEAIE